jgi:WD40 repeat protein
VFDQITYCTTFQKDNVLNHTDDITDVAWNTHMEHILASASADRSILLWDVDVVEAHSQLNGHKSVVGVSHFELY